MGVKLPDFIPDMSMRYSFHTYSLPGPSVECHEVSSAFMQKRYFVTAILLTDDV